MMDACVMVVWGGWSKHCINQPVLGAAAGFTVGAVTPYLLIDGALIRLDPGPRPNWPQNTEYCQSQSA